MTKGTYKDFRDALRALESGWDRARFEAGLIHEWYLDQQARGSVRDFFPTYSSWADLSDEEWDVMSYRSMNALGFVGYHFGEALLTDLGYYDDGVVLGSGASNNTWEGVWTGKNGIDSLEDFMSAGAQEVAIQEAFGHYLQIIEKTLASDDMALDEFIGAEISYGEDGETRTSKLTLTGIMADAHLRGAWATLALLQSGEISQDIYGTSALRNLDRFSGYDGPTVSEAVAFYRDRLSDNDSRDPLDGDDGGSKSSDDQTNSSAVETLATVTDGAAQIRRSLDKGTAGVTEDTADVVLKLDWGTELVISDFDPASDTIFVGLIGADALDVREEDRAVVFDIPLNSQFLRLERVSFAKLSAANFTIQDASAARKILGLIEGNPEQGASEDSTDGDHKNNEEDQQSKPTGNDRPQCLRESHLYDEPTQLGSMISHGGLVGRPVNLLRVMQLWFIMPLRRGLPPS